MQLAVFGYGSLMNPASLAKTLPLPRDMHRSTLKGFERICNAPVNGYAYLNIRKHPNRSVEGVLIPVMPHEIEWLKAREVGYACVDVTQWIYFTNRLPKQPKTVVAFIAPDIDYPGLLVPRTYIRTCLQGIHPENHDQWLEETIIPHGVHENEEPRHTPTIPQHP
jgi:cation transport regulator ChaC